MHCPIRLLPLLHLLRCQFLIFLSMDQFPKYVLPVSMENSSSIQPWKKRNVLTSILSSPHLSKIF